MKKILIFVVLMLCIIFSANVYATNLSWSGSGVSGTDPLGHPWTFSNLRAQTGQESGLWSIPAPGSGGVTFIGEFVKDFHITFDLGDFPGQEIMIEGRTFFWETTNSPPVVEWETQFMDNDQRIDTVWFFAPPGEQLSFNETFFTWVEFELPWTSDTGTLVTPNFVAQWTDTGSIPEPSTFLLLGAGLAGMGLLRRRLKN